MNMPGDDRVGVRAGDAVMYTYNHRTIPCIHVSGIRVRVEKRPFDGVSMVYTPASMFSSARWQWTKLVILDSLMYMTLVAEYREESLVVPSRHLIMEVDDYHQLSEWSISILAGCLDPSIGSGDAVIELIAEQDETILVPNVVRGEMN